MYILYVHAIWNLQAVEEQTQNEFDKEELGFHCQQMGGIEHIDSKPGLLWCLPLCPVNVFILHEGIQSRKLMQNQGTRFW